MAASTGVRVTTLAGSVTYEHVTVTREGEMLLVNRKDGSPLVWVTRPWLVEYLYE